MTWYGNVDEVIQVIRDNKPIGTAMRDDCIRSLESMINEGLVEEEEGKARKLLVSLRADKYTDIKIVYR